MQYLIRSTLPLTILVFVTLFASDIKAGDKKTIPGIGPDWKSLKKYFGGFKFTEGPAFDKAGNLYFNDIPNNVTFKVTPKGKKIVFRMPSNHSNGLMVNGKGEIVACEMDGRLVAVSPDGQKVRILADTYKGRRFNAPNDVVIDKAGGYYFTDPGFRAPKPLPQGKTCVYYVSESGEVSRLIDDLPNPNGVILSPDEKTLYVIPSGQKEMMEYPVSSPGKIGKGTVFCRLKQAKKGGNRGGDGLTVDVKGNLYITSGLGLQVFNPVGTMLGIIKLPQVPANVAFGGSNGNTLYVTARSSLYTIRTMIPGHVFPGKK